MSDNSGGTPGNTLENTTRSMVGGAGGHDAHGPRVARSASNQPLIADKDRPDENKPVRPKQRGKKPHARRMNLSLTRVDAWSVAKVKRQERQRQRQENTEQGEQIRTAHIRARPRCWSRSSARARP